MSVHREEAWLSWLLEKPHAVRLVRDLLGCTCPAEVFENYQVRSLPQPSPPMVQLVMGDRLLVRIVDAERLTDPEQTAKRLLEEGVQERERRGLNRFRLVLVGPFPAPSRKRLLVLPEGFDERAHVHLLPQWPGRPNFGPSRTPHETLTPKTERGDLP